jgi:two-component system response regulator DevR
MANKQPLRLLIVEDQRVVADAVRQLINDQPDMVVVGTAGSVSESVSCVTKLHPDIVLLDFRLPDGNGADAGSEIRQLQPEARLIFLTRDDRQSARLAAFEVGAKAFVPKSKAATDLVGTIRVVGAGGSLLQPPIRGRLSRPIHDTRSAARRSRSDQRAAERRVRTGEDVDPRRLAERRTVNRRLEYRRSLVDRRGVSAR